MAEVADSIAGEAGERSAHKKEDDNWFDGVGFTAGLLTNPEENGGLDKEIDNSKYFFFLWAEKSDKKRRHPLRVETGPDSYAVEVRVAIERARLAHRSHCVEDYLSSWHS